MAVVKEKVTVEDLDMEVAPAMDMEAQVMAVVTEADQVMEVCEEFK